MAKSPKVNHISKVLKVVKGLKDVEPCLIMVCTTFFRLRSVPTYTLEYTRLLVSHTNVYLHLKKINY
jgi:hypothetical protein